MSILTRVLVFLVMLMAVLLVGMVVPFVLNTETYKQKYLDERAARVIHEHNAANRESDLTRYLQKTAAEIDKKNGLITQLSDQLTSLNTTLQDQESQIISLRNRYDQVTGELERLASSLELETKINAGQSAELEGLRGKTLRLQERNIELSNSLREKTSEGDSLSQQVRLLQEQLSDATGEIGQLESLLETAGVAARPDADMKRAFDASHPIPGRITEVREIDDDLIVALNVGSNDGVQAGMRFMIHRGNVYLGDAVVNLVDLNSSIAQVELQVGEITRDAEVLAGGLP